MKKWKKPWLMIQEFEQDAVKSSPGNANFVVLLEDLQNNNANKLQDETEFSKKIML